MQFSRGHLTGTTAVANAYADEYDIVFAQYKAEAALNVNDGALLVLSSAVGNADDLGYAVTKAASAGNGAVVGRVMKTVAAGEDVNIQCYGVGLLITDTGAITEGEALHLGGGTAGRVTDAVDATATAEERLGTFAYSLEDDGAAGTTFLAFIRCM